MSIPSVKRIAPAIFCLFLFPYFAQAQLQGKWECSTKSGYYDTNTAYKVRCSGVLHFKPDRTLESTCSDGFFPSGCYWEILNQRLTLRDSGGKAFADFEVRELSQTRLLLVRKETQFDFQRRSPVP